MEKPVKPLRLVQAKKWGLMTSVVATGVAASLGATMIPVGVYAAEVAKAATAEAGEKGEAGVASEDAEVTFLVHLSFFEATVRIVSGLYAAGQVAAAQDHLANSHHADYDAFEDGLKALGAAGFEDLTVAFASAVEAGDPPDQVAAKADQVLAAIATVHQVATVSAQDEFAALYLLVTTSAEDFEAGVENGTVTEPHEYRDAWGFFMVAQARATAMAGSPDTKVAAVAHAALRALEPVAEMFPGLSSTQAGSDPSVIYGAAARVDFAALKAK